MIDAEGFSHVRVLNAGVIGYTSSHALRQLVTRVRELEPDVVTVRVGLNDHAAAWQPALAAAEPRNPLLRWLLYAVHDLRLFGISASIYQRIPTLHPEPDKQRWVDAESFAYNLRRMSEVADSDGFELLFVDYPLRDIALPTALGNDMKQMLFNRAPTLVRLHEKHDDYMQIGEEVAMQLQRPWLKSAAAFASARPPAFSAYDFVHPNPDGQRLLARLLFDEMRARGWLSAR